jgi:hypothetical protein
MIRSSPGPSTTMRSAIKLPFVLVPPTIRFLVCAPVPTDKVERHLVTQAAVREVTHAVNVWAYSVGV